MKLGHKVGLLELHFLSDLLASGLCKIWEISMKSTILHPRICKKYDAISVIL